MRTVVLIRGYIGHGKTTFSNALCSKSLYRDEYYNGDGIALQDMKTGYKWTITECTPGSLDTLRLARESLAHFASADYLKRIVADDLGVTVEFLDTNKDNYVRSSGRTYRSFLIETAKRCKEQDKFFFIKRIPKQGNVAVSDFRFPEEEEYVSKMADTKKIIIKVVDEKKPILKGPTEHMVDDYDPDILVKAMY